MFRAHVLITYRCDDTRGCVIQFWPPDDEHMCSKHVEAWNKLIVKQKFCASSLLNTEINILIILRIYIKNCPTRCNTKQSIYYSTSSLYMFRVSTEPIMRSTQNCNYSLRYCAATSLQFGQASLNALEEGSCTKLWPLPEAVVTVLCTTDDGCGWHPKHVEWTCRIINRLLSVASRSTIINIDQRCTEP